jgi:hypothetical protein
LRRFLEDICKERNGRYIGEFYTGKTYFVVKDGSKVHGKTDTKENKGLCNKARVEYFIYLIDWPSCSPDLNLIKNV